MDPPSPAGPLQEVPGPQLTLQVAWAQISLGPHGIVNK